MEDLFQETEKALEVSIANLDTSQTAEKAATYKVEQLTTKLEESQKSEAALKADKADLSGKLKTSESAATQAKKDLTVQQEKYAKDTTKLQKDLSTVQANEQVLIKSNRQLVDGKAEILKELDAANKKVANYKKNFDAPVPEVANVLIRHIFFGSVRITSPNVYQKVLDSYTHKDGCTFTVNSRFVEGADPGHQSAHSRWLVIYYAVRNGAGGFVDRLPQWYKEGPGEYKFNPNP